jgi:nitroreductase
LSKATDLFDVMKRRRACRSFVPKPIPNELLEKIVYAAHRAPTGGNIPYRFVVVVKDPVQLRMLKAASPGYFGESTAAIVICTDLRGETGSTKVDAEQCTLYDAGAAAENVVLAAYALGLGASFIKSYSETAIRRILDLPAGCRSELIVSLGYPSPDEPPPIKKRPEGKITYFDNYGNMSKDSTAANGSATSMSPEQYLFEYTLFLLTAARGVTSEPRTYGAIRLLDAISKLTGLYSLTNAVKPDPFIIEAKKKIDTQLDTAMASEEDFMRFIDGLVGQFANELKKRYGRAVPS